MHDFWRYCTGVVRGVAPYQVSKVASHLGNLQQSKMQILQNPLRDAYRVKGEIMDTQSVTFNFVLRRTRIKDGLRPSVCAPFLILSEWIF